MNFRPVRRTLAPLAIAALSSISMSPRASAAIETTGDDARVILPAPAFAFSGNSNTIFLWVRREQAPGSRAILDIPGALNVVVNESGDLSANVVGMTTVPRNLPFTLPGALPENEWALLTITVDSPTGDVTIAAESASAGLVHQSVALAEPFSMGPASGNLTLGTFNSRASMRGAFGILVVRDNHVTLADMQEIFQSRHHFGPYNLDNLADGGTMSGASGALWMINHALFSQPFNGSNVQWNSLALAAEPNEQARVSDFVVFNRSSGFNTESLAVVRNVTAVDSMLYRSPFDVDPGFFLRARPTTTSPLPPNPVAGVSATLRSFAELQPPLTGMPLQVVASANSRGVRTQDVLGNTGNYAQGFTFAMFETISGVVLRPAFAGDVGPYFALYTTSKVNDRVRRSPDTRVLDVTNFSRFWTGSLRPVAPGPGTGVILPNPDSFYSLRARGEPGSRLTDDDRVLVRAYMLAYPGSAPAQIFADVGPTQSAPGTQTLLSTTVLDTSIPSRTTTLNAVVAPTELLANGNLLEGTDPISPGMAVTIATGLQAGDIAVITLAEYLPDNDVTRLIVSHPFLESPSPGETLLFGEFRYEIVEYIHDPVSDDNDWRGLEIRNAGDPTHLPIALFAFDAMNPDDGGYAIGPAGASGRGYERQLIDLVPGAFDKMAQAIDADIWIQLIAHQYSPPSSMADFTAALRGVRPDIEILWLACAEYETTTHESWQRFILEESRANNVVGMTVLNHPDIGSYPDFAADGALINGGHVTARGNTKIALAALEYLRSAARWPGDANNDARVDFADLNALLSNFGASGTNDGSVLGDVNLDGFVDFADLNAVLSNFGTSVDD